ncbi:MAG: efflux RND transporter permease subunit [Geminicoccaceae bacterium]|nr:efflux RND transporter permease subunit [Geminicoccaceae bacterium]MCS7266631.1 efflux RND transporter permease subunit [Geminicoccaceae bacterium]MCX7629255.1 efflux RND transporter permease subunit [Geminicoccaceae bacterium]MDW8123264.1 efflux RND transporter permease subunit [Geminicoccaceae bacterium]
MLLSDVSVHRPVFASVLSLVILLVGLMAWSRLPVREYPKIEEPVVSVQTTYRGASADIIESRITQPLEEALSGIEGLDVMTSSSRPERSQINLRFRVDRDPEAAAADVRDRVAQARARLPDDADEPVVRKVEADSQPIIYIALASDRHGPMEVSEMADRLVKDRLQNLPGVAEVRIFGERQPSMRIWLDRMRLAGYGLTPQDVEEALRRQNIEVPAGRIESRGREFEILAETDLRTVEQFNELIIRDADGYLVRLKDVGEAQIAPLNERVTSRFNGRLSTSVGVVKQATANPLEVAAAVREVLPKIREVLPEGVVAEIGYDSTIFIERAIENVYRAIVEAIVLVVLVIFFFLRSLRATLVPLVTIPVSLVGAFVFMWALGFSINTLTLLAMVLAVGLVVDDAIVMLENIARHVEMGKRPFRAALDGAREIGFAIVAMTITLAAVYAPIAFQTGRTGRLFVEFALTLAGAVLVSGFVALTLSPMMCSLLLRHEQRHNVFYRAIEAFLAGLTRAYRASLAFALSVRPAVVALALVVAGFAVLFFRGLPSELAPVEDRGTVVTIGVAPEGSTLAYTDRYARMIEEVYRSQPLFERIFVVIGFGNDVARVTGFGRLVDWDERTVKQQDVTRELAPKMFQIPGILAFPSNPPSLGQSPVSKPVQYVLQTSQPYSVLERAVEQLLAAARRNPGLLNLDTDLKLNKPQIAVQIDREKAALMGIDVRTIGQTVETMLGGRQVTRFKRDGKQYEVVVQVKPQDRATPGDLSQIFVRGAGGVMVPLANLVTIEEKVAPKELNHFNKLRSATISATLAPGYSLGEALAFLDAEAAKLDPSIVTDLDGQSREFRQSATGLWIVFLLALVFIYLVLAAQFESWVDPFVIMLTVPLSMTGALLALQLTGQSLNVYSQIGLVTLVGLITKHGILIVEFANQLRARGRSIADAVLEASVLRLRPILMTTGAMVLGSVPLALATGAGAEGRQAIGWVIAGGLSLGTFFTLYVVPVAYTLFTRRTLPRWVREQAERERREAEGAAVAPPRPVPAE